MNDAYYMRLAIETAKEGIKKGQLPFAACIVKEGAIIGCQHSNLIDKNDPTAHAEIAAIRYACEDLETTSLSNAVIYCTCEPCPMCFSACHFASVQKIVYGASLQDAKLFGFNELFISNDLMKKFGKAPIIIQSDFLNQECLSLFKMWTERKHSKI